MSDSIDISRLPLQAALSRCSATSDIDEIIELTRHPDGRVRQRALKEMCPCRVKDDVEDFWNRVMDMLNDEDPLVRKQVLHTLCDGSPKHMEFKVADALDVFNRDANKEIRRMAHKALTAYRKTEGKEETCLAFESTGIFYDNLKINSQVRPDMPRPGDATTR